MALTTNGPVVVGGVEVITTAGAITADIQATAGSISATELATTLDLSSKTVTLGAIQENGTLTVGVDDTGYDVQLFGATAGRHLLWDESADSLKLVGGATLDVASSATLGANGGDTVTVNGVATMDGGMQESAATVVPNSDSGAASVIKAGNRAVGVAAVTTNADDWIVLPALSTVPVGHEITIMCNAGGNFELRTPATSGELINTVDSDGTNELLMVDTEVVKIVKVSDADGWMARSFTALGADNTALVPNA